MKFSSHGTVWASEENAKTHIVRVNAAMRMVSLMRSRPRVMIGMVVYIFLDCASIRLDSSLFRLCLNYDSPLRQELDELAHEIEIHFLVPPRLFIVLHVLRIGSHDDYHIEIVQ
jgi:hypothetical protein